METEIRETTCVVCNKVFKVARVGPVPEFCLDCRQEARKKRYRARYVGRYYIPHGRVAPLQVTYQELALVASGQACECCGTKVKRLYTHHRDGKGQSKVRHPNNHLDNLEVLCGRCHMKAHNIGVRPDLARIKQMRHADFTFQAIGEYFGVSRQRVHQLLNKK